MMTNKNETNALESIHASSATAARSLVGQLDHINLSVTNLADSIAWYARVFDFAVVETGVWRGMPWAIVRAGDALLAMYEAPSRHVSSVDEAANANMHRVAHIGLRVRSRAEFEARVAREHVAVEQIVDNPFSMSWYVFDPSGWEIEIACWNDDEIRFPDVTDT